MAEQKSRLAFKALAKDDAGSLAGALEGCTVQEWTKWQNRANQSLLALCKERGAFRAYSLLAGSLNLRVEVVSLTPECDKVVKAFRAVAHDDIASLAAILGGIPANTWLRWQNKAKKDLLTMSCERNSKGAFALLKRALISPLPIESSTIEVQPRIHTVAETTQTLAEPESTKESPKPMEEPASPPAKQESDEEHMEDLSLIEEEPKEESSKEKRLAEDGVAYTKEEFIAFLGPEEAQRQWDGAERVLEKRQAEDGNFYTRDEFISFLGSEEGQQQWNNATPA